MGQIKFRDHTVGGEGNKRGGKKLKDVSVSHQIYRMFKAGDESLIQLENNSPGGTAHTGPKQNKKRKITLK